MPATNVGPAGAEVQRLLLKPNGLSLLEHAATFAWVTNGVPSSDSTST